ncbi:FHA domain-containing protein [Kiritimatiellota bacterium B12222]|nr:FHA domain-containing protein [Kiritimatiellota bacterium B12222]
MDTTYSHLLIEEGPEKGREITIPENGARIGRAEENDISIADAAMSRFQCRMYFRDGFLHLMDLGSTNESLVNNQPVSDVALRFGDKILIGESLLKVIRDGLHDKSTFSNQANTPPQLEPEAAPAPIIFNLEGEDTSSASPKSIVDAPAPEKEASLTDVDLGFGKREELLDNKEKAPRKSNLSLLLLTLVITLLIIGGGLLYLTQTTPHQPIVSVDDENITVYYEKVIAGNGNIFRYALELSNTGEIKAEVHDLLAQRNVIKEETVAPEQLQILVNQLLSNKDSLMALQDEYEGLPAGDFKSYTLTILYGKEAKTIRVANQLEPDVFKQAREQIETFANNELGLINRHIPPEVLRAQAAQSWENAQKLYDARDVKNSNLWQATQLLKDVIFLLESIEPKPPYYEQAVILRQQWRKTLEDKVSNLEFEAIRAVQVGDRQRSMQLYRLILATLPDPENTQYKQAYNRLTQIEQELN